MRLTIGEKIMIIRNRAKLRMVTLGEEVYNKMGIKKMGNPNTRIQKIERGIILPENFLPGELKAIATALNMPESFFEDEERAENDVSEVSNAVAFSKRVIDMFPNLLKYVEIINNIIDTDSRLCVDVLKKMAIYAEEVLDSPDKKVSNGFLETT